MADPLKKIFGRPPKTLKDFPPDWQQIILDEMSNGASLEEIKVYLGISNDLFYRFLKEEIDFSETIAWGKQLSKAWWMRMGRINLWNRKFNCRLWYMNMKNRWGWTDKQETNVNIQVPTSIIIPQKEKTIRLLPPEKVKELE